MFGMSEPLTVLAVACTMALYVTVALCAMWAWDTRQWFLATPLTIIFLIATGALIWTFERWGT